MLNIYRRELAGYFSSPIAYVFLVIFLLLCNVFTFELGQFYQRRQADLMSFFGYIPFILVFFGPAISMRLWSEERKSGTVQLLFTLPITVPQAVVGKFLAAWTFMGIALLLTFPMIVTVNYLGNPDQKVLFAGYIGAFLMSGSYIAIGSVTSAMTKNQVISLVIAFCLCLVMVLAGYHLFMDKLSFLPYWMTHFISSLGFTQHFDRITKGILKLGDLVYFIGFIALMLFANVQILESRKAS